MTSAQLIGRNIAYDGVHLTSQGSRMVAEAVAQYMGLSVRSKALAERLDSSWNPLILRNGATNASNNPLQISAWRINNETLELTLNINMPSPGTHIATMDFSFYSLRGANNYRSLPDANGNTAIITIGFDREIRIYADGGSASSPAQVLAFLSIPLSNDLRFVPYY